MDSTRYIGSGSYCYANSTAMLLASIGEEVSPALVEVLTGVGLSASISIKDGFLFFNYQPLLPDLGITRALDLMGFSYHACVSESASEYPADQLREALQTSAAVIGPVDMGYLPYNPHHRVVHADHYVYAYAADGEIISIHDPAGYPHVFSSFDGLREAWQAEAIGYRRGYYRFVSHPQRIKTPGARELNHGALAHFAELYQKCATPETGRSWITGSQAIDQLADRVEAGAVSDAEKNHLLWFALPLGARRANDFAYFFKDWNGALRDLKIEQAGLFGAARTHLVMENPRACAQALRRLGDAEARFAQTL